MTALAFPFNDETKRPVREKAETAQAVFRHIHNCDPAYLRVGIHDAYCLVLAGFDDVPLVVDECVAKNNFYAVRP
jgi:hypothetical protein